MEGGSSPTLKGMARFPSLAWFGFLTILFVSISATRSADGASQEGFISIDCGYSDGPSYEDPETNMTFSPDALYVATGESKIVARQPSSRRLIALRSFPEGYRNCYKLWPVQSGRKYLIRAEFFYGNYDKRSIFPKFDLHLGANYWTTVLKSEGDNLMTDIITVASRNLIWVCLINTGEGIPFISTLELRPLTDFMYPIADAFQMLVYGSRINFGGQKLRYPDDQYDRIWSSGLYYCLNSAVNSSIEVAAEVGDQFQVPAAVLATACVSTVYAFMDGDPREGTYSVVHFAEFQKTNSSNDTRLINILGALQLLYANYTPPFGKVDHKEIKNTSIQSWGSFKVSITNSTSNGRLPIVNALELYLLRGVKWSLTHQGDVDAIYDLKQELEVSRNWQGDPCSPKEHAWEGVGCKYEEGLPPRIISLSMPSSQLGGEIPHSIANLTALIFLDLSNNEFTGVIPHFLYELPSLKLVDLTNNSHTLVVPQKSCQTTISIEGTMQCKHSNGQIKRNIFIISASISFTIVVIITSICIWKAKRRAQLNLYADLTQKSKKQDLTQYILDENDAQPICLKFTSSQIQCMTRGFQNQIGKGISGMVYLGYLDDDVKVAVKIISTSSLSLQRAKELQSEALLLSHVHHKNLISLIGYCDDDVENLSLVYEYMEGGSINDILSGKSISSVILNWEKRIRIALDAAQGLYYLHNGCQPSIIHKNVKSTNILINRNFVTKLGDFGPRRDVHVYDLDHMSSIGIGSQGYLDPEYHLTSIHTMGSDVYSFGVFLLELITGQQPFVGLSKNTHIIERVHENYEKGDLHDIVDSRMQVKFNQSIFKAIDISRQCTMASSNERSHMSNVVMMLKQCLNIETSSEVCERGSA